MEKRNLICYLQEIPEFRRRAGLRHPLSSVLLIVIMAKMSGCHSFRSMGDFVERHRVALAAYFQPKNDRLPSFLTIRKVLQGLDFRLLFDAFHQWAAQYIDPESLIHIDGKSIRSTVSNYDNAQPDFTALVSAYCSQSGQVIAAQAYQNATESEVNVGQNLLKQLNMSGQTYSFDALHCKKNASINR